MRGEKDLVWSIEGAIQQTMTIEMISLLFPRGAWEANDETGGEDVR
jgi:hypothetical protein